MPGDAKRTWVSMVGSSVFAVVNPVWASCRSGYVPDAVYLLANRKVMDNLERVEKILRAIISEYGKEPEIRVIELAETDFRGIASAVGGVIKREKLTGSEVAVDMTPGRKFMSAIMMYSGLGEDVEVKADRVYYLHLEESNRYSERPWIRIPAVYQNLYDMKRSLLR